MPRPGAACSVVAGTASSVTAVGCARFASGPTRKGRRLTGPLVLPLRQHRPHHAEGGPRGGAEAHHGSQRPLGTPPPCAGSRRPEPPPPGLGGTLRPGSAHRPVYRFSWSVIGSLRLSTTRRPTRQSAACPLPYSHAAGASVGRGRPDAHVKQDQPAEQQWFPGGALGTTLSRAGPRPAPQARRGCGRRRPRLVPGRCGLPPRGAPEVRRGLRCR